MKILFIARSTLYKNPGGDTIQVQQTAAHLEKLGIDVTIRLTNEAVDYRDYDLLHFFNIIRPADILQHSTRSGKPYVVSTVFVDYSEYDQKMRDGLPGLLFRVFSPDQAEYFKAIARRLINGEKIISPLYYLLGQRRSIRRIIRKASVLLPNSENEYTRLVASYGVPQRYRVVPNAIDPSLFRWSPGQVPQNPLQDKTPPQAMVTRTILPRMAPIPTFKDTERDPGLVLCVARIEGLKNQLNLILALRDTPFRLIFIGSASHNHLAYYKACREAAGSQTLFIENLPQEELLSYYRQAHVHVLPSWFETTGLSSLEAAAMGCKIVITDKGDTREYFGKDAWYCDPASPASVREAVTSAASAPYNDRLRERILTQYTWERTAQETMQAYKEILT